MNAATDPCMLLMRMIEDASKRIRTIEDDCKKFSVAPGDNCVYTAWVGYRSALQDALVELRRFGGAGRSD